MSHPFPPPAPSAPAGPHAGGPPAVPQPAAPTQVAFPGQVQLPPQPQFTPTPQQAAATRQGPPATGFPHYVSPPPSPADHTTLLVGIVVCVLTLLFAVVGFALVA